jgi:hypothetical protein
LGDELFKLGNFYNQAWFCIEANNHGLAVINHIKDKYYNLYRSRGYDSVSDKVTDRLGYYNMGDKKIMLIDNLVAALREGIVKVKSEETLNELSTFQHIIKKLTDGRFLSTRRMEAASGCFDDRVIGLGLAYEMMRVRPVTETGEVFDPMQYQGFEQDIVTGFFSRKKGGTNDFTL